MRIQFTQHDPVPYECTGTGLLTTPILQTATLAQTATPSKYMTQGSMKWLKTRIINEYVTTYTLTASYE